MINYVSANIIDILGGKIEEFVSPGLRYEFLRENKTWTVPMGWVGLGVTTGRGSKTLSRYLNF